MTLFARIALPLAALLVLTGALQPKRSIGPHEIDALKKKVTSSKIFKEKVLGECANEMGTKHKLCLEGASNLLLCTLMRRIPKNTLVGAKAAQFIGCDLNNPVKGAMKMLSPVAKHTTLLQVSQSEAPVDELAKEMTHDLELNFNKIAPFGKEDTAKELQDHAARRRTH